MYNFKIIARIAFIGLLLAIGYIVVDWRYQRAERIRQTENARQLRWQDSLRFASQLLTKEEIKDYLVSSNSDLKKLLKESQIRENRLQSILSVQYKYRDTTSKTYDFSNLLEAIDKRKEMSQPFLDTTQCMTIKGNVEYTGSELRVNITDREFKNKMDNVVYWERKQWRFLGIKTRFLGKRQFTAKTFDQCGESIITKVEKK